MSKLLAFVWLIFLEWTAADQCGVPVPEGKIVGGVDSGRYRYPWFALLLHKQKASLPVPICGGSLISSQFVVSAAHCFTIDAFTPKKELFTVALGVYNICNEIEESRQIFSTQEVYVHEKYQRRDKFFDIALIKLTKPAGYTVICLPISGVPDITESALLIGFGVTSETSDQTPCHLMEVNVTKFSRKDCQNTKLPAEDKKEPSIICAGAISGNVDSCYGDSGGPLHTKTSDGRYMLAGIVSYGYGCAVPDTPGVYTNVGSYIHWINNKMSQKSTKKVSKIPQTRTGGFKRHHTTIRPINRFSFEPSALSEGRGDPPLGDPTNTMVIFSDQPLPIDTKVLFPINFQL